MSNARREHETGLDPIVCGCEVPDETVCEEANMHATRLARLLAFMQHTKPDPHRSLNTATMERNRDEAVHEPTTDADCIDAECE